MKKIRGSRHLIILITIILLATYLRLTNLNHPLWPDEALYARVGENLYTGKGLTFHGVLFHQHPPLFITTLSMSYKLLGLSLNSARIVGPLFGVLGVIAVYSLGGHLYNEKVGLLAAFFLAFTPVHWFLSRMILTDIAFTTLLTLAVLFFYLGTERSEGYAVVAGVLIGLVCLTKTIGPIIYLIFGSYLILSERNFSWIKKKEIQKIFAISLLIQLPWYALKFWVLERPSIVYNSYPIEFSTPQYLGIFTVLKILPFTLSKPVFLLVPLGIFFMIKKIKKVDILIIMTSLIFLLANIIWYSVWIGRAIEVQRYLVPTLPFFSIIAAYGLWELSTKVEKKHIYTLFIVIFVIFTIVTNAHQGEGMGDVEWTKYQGYYSVGRWIDQNTPKDSVLVSDCNILYYYSERSCIVYATDIRGFHRSIEDLQEDVYLLIETQNSISPTPPYILNYINEYPGSVYNVKTSDIDQSSKVEIFRIRKNVN